ncbi:MAG: hypothetical protein JSW26_04620 [Desulfobacterales bacterium]|nr:MAG: hypothetical protein JSW26_04620 [Desulfobacterales bacterium]
MAGQSGQALEAALRTLSPEIYGSMNDPKRIELKGLEYIMDRLPRGIEQCSRFVMTDELLQPLDTSGSPATLKVQSISIMGKAGILPGKKGDIMLATAHVLEGPAHNYIVDNDLSREDFDDDSNIYAGPIVTVLGTSLQNRDILDKFQTTSWKAVGLEMEGGHYQRAINAAIIRGHIPKDVKVRYAYYASDNPLKSVQTLAAGPMGLEGIRPTYMKTKAIIHKILGERQ